MGQDLDKGSANYQVIAENIDRDSVGSRLTPEAREKAIEFGLKVWKGQMGNGEATRVGIEHVTSGIFKK